MKPSFKDLTPEQQATYGNGCGLRLLPVPSFNFHASCQHHDFNFERGSGTWWKAPYYYTKANVDFLKHMWQDCTRWYHYPIAILYFVTVQLLSWPFFTVGKWRTVEEILERDRKQKMRRGII
jgi:hypothetical protein